MMPVAFGKVLRSIALSAACRARSGSQRPSALRPHVRFLRVQTLVREGSPLVKLRNSA